MSTVEFALTALLFFMLLFGIVDMARLAWEFNSAAKAAQWGARFAAVRSNVVVPALCTNYLDTAGGNGRTLALGSVANVSGPPADPLVIAEMRKIYSRADATNVLVTYRHVGLGFAGNPVGPDFVPTVTVEFTGLQFVPTTPGLTFATFNMPAFATSMPAENVPC